MDLLVSSAYINIEHEDQCGNSALAIAARNGDCEVLEHLLKLRRTYWKVSTQVPTNEYKLLAHAVHSQNTQCINLVKKYRTWRYGDSIYYNAMDYAKKHKDAALSEELVGLQMYDTHPQQHAVPQINMRAVQPLGSSYDLLALTSQHAWQGNLGLQYNNSLG
jgi:hypothetical protein